MSRDVNVTGRWGTRSSKAKDPIRDTGSSPNWSSLAQGPRRIDRRLGDIFIRNDSRFLVSVCGRMSVRMCIPRVGLEWSVRSKSRVGLDAERGPA